MFVFERSFWSVIAGLGTAAVLVVLMLYGDSAAIRAPLELPAAAPAPHDISLANR